MWHELEYELADELAYELENEDLDLFDPSPPPPNTIILPRFRVGRPRLRSRRHRRNRRIISKIARLLANRAIEIFLLEEVTDSECEKLVIKIVGHEDDTGDPARFKDFGQMRAEAVASYLKKRINVELKRKGAVKDFASWVRLSPPSSEGPFRPIRSNVTRKGRAMNRRVEIRAEFVNHCVGGKRTIDLHKWSIPRR